MTTSTVASITDEQLAEIERFLAFGGSTLKIHTDQLRGLIARLRASEKDAARYRWLRDEDRLPEGEMFGQLIVGESEGEDCYFGDQLDSVIDLHMEQQP